MHLRDGQLDLTILNEAGDSSEPSTFSHAYDRVIDLSGAFRPTSNHGVICRDPHGRSHSVLIFAEGGCSGVHDRSAVVVGEVFYLAVGDSICAFSLPELNLIWNAKVDSATCFGVYYSKEHHCLLSHGELEIARVSLGGEIIWSYGGTDIFSGDFRIVGDCVEAVDFNGDVYRFEIGHG
jgi:hypothetical protein